MTVSFNVYGEGSAIVLLHGSMASKEQWIPLTNELARDYQVVSLDLLGYGAAPQASPDTYSLRDESDRLRSVLDKTLSPDKAYHLVGHSYGGVVALYHAFHHPKQVKSLTIFEPMAFHLLEPDHPLLAASRMMVEEITRDIAAGNEVEGASKFIDLWMPPGTFDKISDQEKKALGKGVRKMVLDFRAAANESLSPSDYSKLAMPVCLIAGKASPPYSLCISEVVAAAIPHLKMHWVEGGHFAPVSHGRLVNPIIADFVKSVDDSLLQTIRS